MPELAPASGSPLLTPTLPATAPKRSSLAAPCLDDKVEYLDGFGVPRRSGTFTVRMVMRGRAIEMPEDLVNRKGELGESEAEIEKQRLKDEREFEQKLRELKAKQKANAEFKHQCKTERQQWIDEADKRIVERLTVWYDGSKVPADAEYVDITERNTELSPSKKSQAFIDPDGNLRRKSVPPISFKPADTTSQNETEPVAEVRPADAVAPPGSMPPASTAGNGSG